jgi:hypothetical protein
MNDRHQPEPRYVGPLETGSWPERLCARVVTPGSQPRIHGYDVEADLARHYRWTDLLLLSLTGELPTPAASAAVDVAMTFLAPVSVAHASTHATVLARLCGASTSTTLGTAAIGLAEQARFLVSELEDVLVWLDNPGSDLPEQHRAKETADVAGVERLIAALERTNFSVPGLSLRPTLPAALVIVLHACGLTRAEQIESAIVISRMPAAVAEALQERATNFREYPVNLPRYVYEK